MAYNWLNPALRGSSQMPAYSPYGSYDSNNLDSQNMRGASATAYSRVKGSSFFPYAAAQAAAAEGNAEPMPYQTPPQRTPTGVPQLSARDKIAKAAEDARKATEQRYADTLAGHDERRATAMGLAAGGGLTDAEISTTYNGMAGLAGLRSRGIGPGMMQNYAGGMAGRQLGNISFDKAMQLARLDSQLSGDKLSTMASRNDEPPDLRAMMAAEREIGSGNMEGMTYPGGPPAIDGNPYGMPMGGGQQMQPQQVAEQGGDSKQGGGKGGAARPMTYKEIVGDRLRKRYATKPAPKAAPYQPIPSVAVRAPMPQRPMPTVPQRPQLTYANPQTPVDRLAAAGRSLKRMVTWQ